MDPSDDPYDSPAGYGANKVAAELAYLESELPVSVLRPSRIHGVKNRNPREWAFVKRALDGRHRLPLARGGRGVNHPTAASNLAALVATCAAHPSTRVLNSADPDAPDGLAIARSIVAHLGHEWDEILLDDNAPPGVGNHPWNSVPPVVLDTSASTAMGYPPIGTYHQTVRPAVDWLIQTAQEGDRNHLLPGADWSARFLDYAREDEYLTPRTR